MIDDAARSEEFEEVAPIETMLSGEAGKLVPVNLQAAVTEVGTLELRCLEKGGPGRWKLEMNVRTKEGTHAAIVNNVSMSALLFGIDLGTSNCAVAYVDAAGGSDAPVLDFPIVQTVRPADIRPLPLLPSAIYLPHPNELPPESYTSHI